MKQVGDIRWSIENGACSRCWYCCTDIKLLVSHEQDEFAVEWVTIDAKQEYSVIKDYEIKQWPNLYCKEFSICPLLSIDDGHNPTCLIHYDGKPDACSTYACWNDGLMKESLSFHGRVRR